MFCPSCGKGVDESDGFCRFCGRSLSADKPASTELVQGSSATDPTGGHEQLPRRSGEATASLILGLFSFIPVVGLLAVIFGHLANASIRRSGGLLLGKGMAFVGLLLGYFALIGWAVYGISFVVDTFPNRIQSNEQSAMGSLRLINTAEITYATTYDGGYSSALADLRPPKTEGPDLPPADEYIKLISPRTAGLLPDFLASGTADGYRYTYVANKRDKNGRIESYAIHADPITPGETGRKHFFTDQSGVIREEMDKPANEHSLPIGLSTP